MLIPQKIELTKETKELLTLVCNKVIVDQWVAGLRSGKWVQYRGAMTNPLAPNHACCLMVLEAECNGKTEHDFLEEDHNGELSSLGLPRDRDDCIRFYKEDGSLVLPQNITARVNSLPCTPASWNDTYNMTFEQIATLLETGEVTIS